MPAGCPVTIMPMDTARELARRTPAGLFSRPEPLRARWELGPLGTSDKHTVRIVFETGLQVGQNPGDLALFAEQFLAGRPTAQLDDVEAFLRPALERAAQAALANLDVGEVCLPGAGSDALTARLVEALKAPTFAVGVLVKPPHHLRASSESWQEQQRREQEAARLEAEQADRKQRLEREKELLATFKKLREELPEVPAGELLARLTPADREATLRASLLQADVVASTLHAVGGTHLLTVSLDRDTAPVLSPLPDILGPARSCNPAGSGGTLAIGMRIGVLLFDPNHPGSVRTFGGPPHTAPTGYNSAAVDATGRWLVATHGDVGLVIWSMDQSLPPRVLECPAARSVVALPDGSWLFAAGSRVLRYREGNLQTVADGTATVLCLAADPGRAMAICSDGSFLRIPLPDFRVERGSFGRPLLSASSVPWFGSTRSLIAGTDGSVELVGDCDGVITRLLGNTRGVQQVDGAAGTASAVSSDRTHVTVWRLWNPSRPAFELSIYSSLRHRIADVLLTA